MYNLTSSKKIESDNKVSDEPIYLTEATIQDISMNTDEVKTWFTKLKNIWNAKKPLMTSLWVILGISIGNLDRLTEFMIPSLDNYFVSQTELTEILAESGSNPVDLSSITEQLEVLDARTATLETNQVTPDLSAIEARILALESNVSQFKELSEDLKELLAEQAAAEPYKPNLKIK